MNIEDIQLTEDDFNLLMEGLESLPEKGRAAFIMGDIIANSLAKGNSFLEKEVEKKMNDRLAKMESKNKEQEDDIILLKSKLILLKRFLQTNGALKTAEKIINKK